MATLASDVLSQDTAKPVTKVAQVLELEISIDFEAGLKPGHGNFRDTGTLVVFFDVTHRNRLRLDGKPLIRRKLSDDGAVTGVAKEFCRYVVTPRSATSASFSPPASDYVLVDDEPSAPWANDMAIKMGLSLHQDTFRAFGALVDVDPVLRFSGLIKKLHGDKLPDGVTIVANPNDPADTLKLVKEPGIGLVEVTEKSSETSWQSYVLSARSGPAEALGVSWPAGFAYTHSSPNDYSRSIFMVKSVKVRNEEPADFNPILKRGTTVHDLRLDAAYTVQEDGPQTKDEPSPSRAGK